MGKIKRLSVHEAQKIAAGEVVDRPANVVKELVENALDADATQITVFIERSGKKLIRVVDNGCGMDRDDALLCFEQHATSKISAVEELQSLATFGFRGEALASIAAVSTVELITKQDSAEAGISVQVQHGTLINESLAGCPTGTDISIHNLFDNVPARKKFLKTDDTEWRSIVHLMHAFCLDYTEIHFKLVHDDKQVFNCAPTPDLIARISQLWDTNLAQSMISFEQSNNDDSITIRGATSHHQYHRYDRSHIYLFVNKRWVKNHQLAQAIIKGYHNVLPPGKYPASCLLITIDPTLVDINIHPRKEEVLFLHPIKVTSLISSTIKQCLEQHLSTQLKRSVQVLAPSGIPTSMFRNFQQPQQPHHGFVPFDFGRMTQQLPEQHDVMIEKSYVASPPQVAFTNTTAPELPKASQPESVREHEAEQQLMVADTHHGTIIGQYHTTYILVDQPDGLFVVDQHAAHERILYELFAKRFEDVATVNLLFPVIITLNEHEAQLIEEHAQLFARHGISVHRFGRDQLIVESLPVAIKNSGLEDLFKQTVGWLQELQHVEPETLFKAIHERLHAQMACKAAIKAGDVLAMSQMQQLLKDLDSTEHKLTCPHGRPTGWLISLYEFEKKFKRKV